MDTLKPLLAYRLRLLGDHPRFYKADSVVRRLERLGLIERTGRVEPGGGRVEFAPSSAGREALARLRSETLRP